MSSKSCTRKETKPLSGPVCSASPEAWRGWHRLACEGAAQDRVTAAARNRVVTAFRRVREHIGNPPRAGEPAWSPRPRWSPLFILVLSPAEAGLVALTRPPVALFHVLLVFFGEDPGGSGSGTGAAQPVVRILHLSPPARA